ncbi:hypothetical protein [Mesorhizobium mediterraneum]|uniref:hypothetical protein n=1 Tax=Mesorhizobium mediterraneum TaxID=43617 RepID=UPI00177CE381|nr:hypothetical protein [Mesorhizobium mediterraneum]
MSLGKPGDSNRFDPVMNVYGLQNFAFSICAAIAPLRLRIPSRGCGFFGDLFMTLNGIRFAELCGADASVEWGNNSLYFDADGGPNAYRYFFEQAEFDIRAASSRPFLDLKYRPTADTFRRYNGLSVRASLGLAFAKYCVVRKEISDAVEEFVRHKFKSRMLGVHIRMTDAAAGLENRKVATLDAYKYHVDKWTEDYPDGSVFLATDDERIVEEFSNRYRERLVVRESLRSTDGISLHGHYDIGVAGSRIRKGKDVLIDALILAHCNYLIRCHSRVTCYTLCVNPTLAFTDLSLELDGVDRTPWLRTDG